MSGMWFESDNIPEAISVSRQQSKLFLVYLTGDDEMSKKMDESWEDTRIIQICQQSCVAIKLKSDSESCKQFSAIYPVLCVPSAYFIDNSGKLVEALVLQSSIEDFQAKIETVTRPYVQASPENEVIGRNSDTNCNEKELTTKEDKVTSAPKTPSGLQVSEKRDTTTQPHSHDEKYEGEKTAPISKVKEQIEEYKTSTAEKFEQKVKERVKEADEQKKKLVELQEKEAEERRILRQSKSRLQFRMPDGSTLTQTFDADDTFSCAIHFIEKVPCMANNEFRFSQVYPKRFFDEEDHSKTFRELGMVPSASLVILPCEKSQAPSGSTTIINQILSLIILIVSLPLKILSEVWKFIAGPSKNTQNEARNDIERDINYRVSSSAGKFDDRKIRRRRPGNMARLSDTADDDDDNATWNGNSTQQM